MSATEVLDQLRILEACQIALPILATTAFLARLYVRVRMIHRFSIDDWFMTGALILFMADCFVGIVLTYKQRALYTGHITDLTKQLTTMQTLVRLDNTFYTLTVLTVKISLGFFFLHIFNINQKIQRGMIYLMMILSTASGIVWVSLIEGTCGIEFAFQTHCEITHAFNTFSIVWSILNATTDVVLTGLSISALWGTKFNPYMKASAIALLALACVGGAISIVRAVIIIEPTSNQIVQVLQIGRWSTIEGGIYIITGSLATLRPLLQATWQNMVESFTSVRSLSTAPITKESMHISKSLSISTSGVKTDTIDETMSNAVEVEKKNVV